MTAQLIDGKAIAARLRQQIAQRVVERRQQGLRAPGLAVILVGSDPASQVYVAHKRKDCVEVGFESRAYDLPETTSQEELLALIDQLNADPAIDGILVQHPAPPQIDELVVFEAIDPAKDVDGVTMASFAAMGLSAKGFHSCTPEGIVRLLDAYRGPSWTAASIALVESHLGQGPRGRPRHDVLAELPLG